MSMTENARAYRARNLRYKRAALASMGFDFIRDELDEMRETCDTIHWWTDQRSCILLDARGVKVVVNVETENVTGPVSPAFQSLHCPQHCPSIEPIPALPNGNCYAETYRNPPMLPEDIVKRSHYVWR